MVKRITQHVFTTLWLTLAVVIILYAVLVVSARELLPLVNRYQPQINAYVSEQTGMDFHVQRLKGLWQGLAPSLVLENIVITGVDGISEAVYVDQVSANLNAGQSLSNLSPVWRSLTAGLIRLHFVEDADGKWSIAGHPLGQGRGNLDYLYRMFYYSRLLRVDSLEINVDFFSGAEATFTAQNIQVDNANDFHRVIANVLVDGQQQESASFIFEGQGDPADADNYVGKGFLRLTELNLEGSLHAFASAILPDQIANLGDVGLDMGVEFWFDWQNNALVNGRGRLKANEIPLHKISDSPAINDFSADITGWVTPGEEWGFQLSNTQGRWGKEALDPLIFQLQQGVGSRWGQLQIATNAVNLSALNRLLLKGGVIQGKASQVLAQLNPTGYLRQVFLDLDFSLPTPKVALRANLENLGIKSWRGAPAARKLNGYVSASATEGYVVIDSPEGFAMHYPQAYKHYMPYGHAVGKVAWRVDTRLERVLVSSNAIKIDGDSGQGTAIFHLDIPFQKKNDPQMYLSVGMKNSHSRYLSRYLPDKGLNPLLLTWLNTAIGDADIEEVGFIWRGSLMIKNHQGRSIQVYAKVKEGYLNYQQGWPALSQLAGTVVVDNTNVHGRIWQAQVGDAILKNLALRVHKDEADRPILKIAAAIDSSVGYGLAMLGQSPVAEHLGGLAELNASGEAHIQLDLGLSLIKQDTAPNSGKLQEDYYRVRAKVDHGQLDIPSVPTLSQVRGTLNYTNKKGLYGNGLKAVFLDNQIKANLYTSKQGAIFDVDTHVTTQVLTPYLKDFSQYFQGETSLKGRLLVPLGDERGSIQLNLQSSLEGMSIDLPAPLAKTKEQAAALDVGILFSGSETLVTGSIDQRLATALVLANGQLLRGEVRLLGDNASIPEDDGLLISGYLPSLNWQQWQPLIAPDNSVDDAPVFDNGVAGGEAVKNDVLEDDVLEDDVLDGTAFDSTTHKKASDNISRLQAMRIARKEEGDERRKHLVALLSPSLNVEVGDFVYEGYSLGSAHIAAKPLNEGWQVSLTSAMVAGDLYVNTGKAPDLSSATDTGLSPDPSPDIVANELPANIHGLLFDLEYLKLPELKTASKTPETPVIAADSDLESSKGFQLAGLKPTDIPELSFSVKALSIGEKNYGNIAFTSNIIDNGVAFSQLSGTLQGVNIRAKPSAAGEQIAMPAELRWTLVDEQHRSDFSGLLALEKMETLLINWYGSAPLTSKSATFFADIGWQGQPWNIKLLNLDGHIGLDLNDGQFYKAASGGTNTLFKLISMINFDTWLRRLRFDFSDLFSEGVSFDSVKGGLLFRNGFVTFDEPIAASMPSGKIRLLGSADLLTETLDAKLIATIPVGTNLPWVAGLLGGLPAAVGVYLTSKIFAKQVDQFSSLSYWVRGSFDDPDIEVEKIFTDPRQRISDQREQQPASGR